MIEIPIATILTIKLRQAKIADMNPVFVLHHSIMTDTFSICNTIPYGSRDKR